MTKTKNIQQWTAAVLFFLGICIAVFYILFSVQYIFSKTIVTDSATYTSLLVSAATASVFYFFIMVRATGFEQDKIVNLLLLFSFWSKESEGKSWYSPLILQESLLPQMQIIYHTAITLMVLLGALKKLS